MSIDSVGEFERVSRRHGIFDKLTRRSQNSHDECVIVLADPQR
jgi:hypothetical protein